MYLIDPQYRESRWRYLRQCLYAFVTTLLMTAVLKTMDLVVIASIASTVFIIFSLPSATTSRARNVIGGHFIGLLVDREVLVNDPESAVLRQGDGHA